MIKDRLITWGLNTIIIVAAATIPVGLFLAYWNDSTTWFYISVGAFIFFMAG